MRRREFIAGLGGGATWPFARLLAAEAERRVGVLLNGTENDPVFQSSAGVFRDGLATFGWVEGHNLRIDYRFAGDPSRLAADAEELVNLRPDVIFAFSGPAARAVRQHTSVIPIVFLGSGDPATNGLVRNIARPEGNITGFANNFASLGGRWLELFKEAVPRLTRVAHIFSVGELTAGAESLDGGLALRRPILTSISAAAAQLGVTIIGVPVRNAIEIEPAISALRLSRTAACC